MAFKPIDPKRDEYRRYLERGGIIESLTKVFVRILQERPEDPTQYLLQNLGDARLQADSIAFLKNELDDARMEIQRLSKIIREINPELLKKPAAIKDQPRDEVSLHLCDSNEVPGTNQFTDPSHFIQREEYTPIGGTDGDNGSPDGNINNNKHVIE